MLTQIPRSTPLSSAANAALMFPTLSAAQIARIASHGVIRPITRGEVLIEGCQTNVPFFVLTGGEIEVIRPSVLGDLLVAVLGPAQFTGDVCMIFNVGSKQEAIDWATRFVELHREHWSGWQGETEVRRMIEPQPGAGAPRG